MSARQTVRVALGARSYDVMVGEGALESAALHLAGLCPNGRAFLIADRIALAHHRDRLMATLEAAQVRPEILEIEGGEGAKSWTRLQQVTETLLEHNIERNEPVIAFGGGTIGDLAGFAAAIVKRGARFIQIPTTLLAQVDSSVGGKTGINTAQGKNLAGAFHQPALVVADTGFLLSLPRRELAAGYAEIVKAGLIGDRALYERLEEAGSQALSLPYLTGFIAASVQFKADIVAEDEREAGRRALLNLGHTFGHAFEAEAIPGTLVHGEAVAAGMVLALRYSERVGTAPEGSAARVARHLREVGLPSEARALSGGPYRAERLIERMDGDKKNSGGAITLILSRGLGDAYIRPGADRDDLTAFLREELHDR